MHISSTNGRRIVNVGQRVLAVASALTLIAGLCILLWATHRGYDISDEGFYLYAAEPANTTKNANGLWGAYLGLIYRMSDYSIVTMRIVGIALLGAAAWWFSAHLTRFISTVVEQPAGIATKLALLVSTVSATYLYYGLGILTPSYNLLTLSGMLVAVGGALGLIAGQSSPFGRAVLVVAISAGSFVAFWCRSASGLGTWAVCMVLVLAFDGRTRRGFGRSQLLLVGAWSVVVLAVFHLTFVTGFTSSLSAMMTARSFSFGGGFSKPMSALVGQSIQGFLLAPVAMIHVTGVVAFLGFSPLVGTKLAPRRRELAVSVLASASVGLCGLWLVLTGKFDGGPGSYSTVTPATLAIASCAGIAWSAAAWVRARTGSSDDITSGRMRVVVVIAGVLFGLECLYAFTSNNGLIGQTSGASVLGLVAAELLLLVAVGRRRWSLAVLTMAAVTPLALISSVTSAIQQPYRGDGPLTSADVTTTISSRGAKVGLTKIQARYFHDLVEPARRAGFESGTPLVDLSPFSPGAAVALGAEAPTTLLFGYSVKTSRWTLDRQDRDRWAAAWLLVDAGRDRAIEPGRVASALGRNFPDDYVLVTTATWPYRRNVQQLWRPR